MVSFGRGQRTDNRGQKNRRQIKATDLDFREDLIKSELLLAEDRGQIIDDRRQKTDKTTDLDFREDLIKSELLLAEDRGQIIDDRRQKTDKTTDLDFREAPD